MWRCFESRNNGVEVSEIPSRDQGPAASIAEPREIELQENSYELYANALSEQKAHSQDKELNTLYHKGGAEMCRSEDNLNSYIIDGIVAETKVISPQCAISNPSVCTDISPSLRC